MLLYNSTTSEGVMMPTTLANLFSLLVLNSEIVVSGAKVRIKKEKIKLKLVT